MQIPHILQLKKFTYYLTVVVFLLGPLACKKHTVTQKPPRVITAHSETTAIHLFYHTILQPLQTITINTPVAGVVRKINFNNGDLVTKNQMLMMIDATKSQQEFSTILTAYIKSKDQYLRSKNSFAATNALYNAGIIAQEDFQNEKSQYAANELAYLTATNSLKLIVKDNPNFLQHLDTLTLDNINIIRKILEQPCNVHPILSPATGIVITPYQNNTPASSDNQNTSLSEGSEVKQHQNLITIATMNGLSCTINIDEIHINQIYLGQSAILTSPALPNMLFNGTVTAISKQAIRNQSGNEGLASFPVQITIAKLSALQKQAVRFGITAKADITINHPPQLKIPLQAIFEKNNMKMVTVIDAKRQKPFDTLVETGATDLTQVVIIKGIRAGDRVLVHD